ncbi:MAG: peptidylprolyl isomerase [Gemmataceae bacterium]|nr:peptidylprolyl isomerase [Gemmataceae bacterium]
MRFHIAFLAWIAAAGLAAAQFGPKPVAVVNGEPIPRSELDAVLKLRPQALTPLTAAQNRAIYEQVITMLVDEVLIRQFLVKNAPPANPAEVDKQFAGLLEGLKKQGRTLADFCKENQQTERQVRAGIENQLRWQAYAAAKITDAELKKYYAESKDFFDKTTVQCSHIVYRVPSDAPPVEKANAEKKMREMREQLVAGKITFAEAAQKYSHCPSATKGGNLGSIFRKMMVEEPFAAAAFKLKPGELSDIVWTDFGVHLILVTDRKPGEGSDFAKVREDVRDCCAEEMRMNLLAELKKAAKVEINLPDK